MSKRGRKALGWVVAAAAAVLAAGTAGVLWLDWHPAMGCWLVVFGLAVVGIPAGILYGTQDKDYFWP